MLGLGNLIGDPTYATDTSGHQDEYFDQQANSTDMRWTVNDTFSIKYIFGYTDYFYDRTTDTELTSNTDTFTPTSTPTRRRAASRAVQFSGDQQFYVSQETEYVSHELQFFNDWTDQLTTTTGLFYYQANISQRWDFYNSNGNGKYNAGLRLHRRRYQRGRLTRGQPGFAAFVPSLPKVGLFTAKQSGLARAGMASLSDRFRIHAELRNRSASEVPFNGNPFRFCFGQWDGDPTNGNQSYAHGPNTPGTSLEYQTRTEREAFALYTQSVYTFNEHFALTLGCSLGARPAARRGEPLYLRREPWWVRWRSSGGELAAMNVAIGAMAPNGQVLDYNKLRDRRSAASPNRCGASWNARTMPSPAASTSTGRRTTRT